MTNGVNSESRLLCTDFVVCCILGCGSVHYLVVANLGISLGMCPANTKTDPCLQHTILPKSFTFALLALGHIYWGQSYQITMVKSQRCNLISHKTSYHKISQFLEGTRYKFSLQFSNHSENKQASQQHCCQGINMNILTPNLFSSRQCEILQWDILVDTLQPVMHIFCSSNLNCK